MVPLLLQGKNEKFCPCDADKFRLKKYQFYNFFKVLKNEDFTKIQQEIPNKLVTDITNMSVLL